MKINLKSFLKVKDRGIVSIPHYIFLFTLLYLGYFIIASIGYVIFGFLYQAMTHQQWVEPGYLFPLLLLILGLLSFITVNRNLQIDKTKTNNKLAISVKLLIVKLIRISFNIAKFFFLWILFNYILGTVTGMIISDTKSLEYFSLWFLFGVVVPIIISRKYKFFKGIFVVNLIFIIWSLFFR